MISNQNISNKNREVTLCEKMGPTQSINPITGTPYYTSNNLMGALGYFYGPYQNNYETKESIFEDPIQAHLRGMEERNPSLNKYRQSFLERLGNKALLLDRAVKYHTGNQHIWKEKGKYKNLSILNEIGPGWDRKEFDKRFKELKLKVYRGLDFKKLDDTGNSNNENLNWDREEFERNFDNLKSRLKSYKY